MSGVRPEPATVVDRAGVAAADWDAVASASDDGWLWHRHDYVGALATWPGREDQSFALRTRTNAIAAIVPFHIVDLVVRGVVIGRLADSGGGPAISPAIPTSERVFWYARAVEAMRERSTAAKAIWLDARLST